MNRQIIENMALSVTVALIILFLVGLTTGCGSQPKQASFTPAPVPNCTCAPAVLASAPAAHDQPPVQEHPTQKQPAQPSSPVQQPVVECPKCGIENALPEQYDYGMELRCSRCGASFPLLETAVVRGNDGYDRKNKGMMYQQGQKPYQGPVMLDQGYFYNVNYYSNNIYDSNVKWNVSPDGSSGSISSTDTRVHEYYHIGDRGRYIGAGKNFRRRGGGY